MVLPWFIKNIFRVLIEYITVMICFPFQENKKTQIPKKFSSNPGAPKPPTKKSKMKTSRTNQELNEINKADSLEQKKATTITSSQAHLVTAQKQSAGKKFFYPFVL